MKKTFLLFFLFFMILGACSSRSSSSGEGPSSNEDTTVDLKSDDTQDLPTVTIDKDQLQPMNRSNAHQFVLKGTCSEEGREVVINIEKVSPSPQPTCTNAKWNAKVDTTSINKKMIQIRANLSDEEGKKAKEFSISVENSFICPSEYIPVPPLAGYTTDNFCIAKYEMKDNGSDMAVSKNDELPWINIHRNDALAKCQQIGSGYDLVTNDEWQTIARNIEKNPTNWDTETVGSIKGISQGHSDNNPAMVLAAGADIDPCFDTGNTCDNSAWHSQRRTHTLSNGKVILGYSGKCLGIYERQQRS